MQILLLQNAHLIAQAIFHKILRDQFIDFQCLVQIMFYLV